TAQVATLIGVSGWPGWARYGLAALAAGALAALGGALAVVGAAAGLAALGALAPPVGAPPVAPDAQAVARQRVRISTQRVMVGLLLSRLPRRQRGAPQLLQEARALQVVGELVGGHVVGTARHHLGALVAQIVERGGDGVVGNAQAAVHVLDGVSLVRGVERIRVFQLQGLLQDLAGHGWILLGVAHDLRDRRDEPLHGLRITPDHSVAGVQRAID